MNRISLILVLDKRLDFYLLFYFHLLLKVDMLSDGGGASPTAIGGFEYGTGVAVRTTAIMSRSDIQEVTCTLTLLAQKLMDQQW